ncbi:MAG: MmgE/PrpD family protein [Firmicutes bacterium]|nr:MmgE/PrpD family protein [Bacillota bacterium]
MSTQVEQISANVLNTSFQNFTQEKLANAKNRIIDVLGCIISGANAPGNLELINLLKTGSGNGEAAILVHGGKAPARDAAMINSIMARSYDFEATQASVNGVLFPSHISGTTVPTALALGDAKDISGKELITALLVGDDVACRILAASGFGFAKGWDNVGTVNAFGATAIAGRLLKLNEKQMQNAFGLILNQLAGSFEIIWDGSSGFKLLQGLSARNGVFSAELAKLGWTGAKDAFFGKFGYFYLYSDAGTKNADLLVADLGKEYHSEVTYKPYPACRSNHDAIDCALSLVAQYDVAVDEIEQIILKVPAAARNNFVGQPFVITDIPHIGAGFSMRFCVANVLLRKSFTLEHLAESFIREPVIANLANKIELVDLTESERKKVSVNMKVIMNDGREYTAEASFAKGDPVLAPFSQEEIKQKFMNNVAYAKTISEANAEKILTMVGRLEEVERISELIGLMSNN